MITKGRPLFGKLALGGCWEQARLFDAGLGEQQARQWLAGSEEVACEAFFEDGFVGVRRRGTPEQVLAFVLGFARAMREDDFADALRTLGVPVGEHLLFTEIGAEGAWNSIGPVRVPGDLALLASALAGTALQDDRAHTKFLECVFDNADGTTHWIARNVTRDGQIDLTSVRAAHTRAFDRYRPGADRGYGDRNRPKGSTMSDSTACSESGCTCAAYSQPDAGSACKTCGHYSGKHTG